MRHVEQFDSSSILLILPLRAVDAPQAQQDLAVANCLAQSEALMLGKSKEEVVAELTAQTQTGGFGLVLDVIGGNEELMTTLRNLPGVTSVNRIGNEIVIQSELDVRATLVHGSIDYTTEMGVGTTFTVTLPILTEV